MIKTEIQEGISPRRVLYMEIKGRQDIPLTRTGDNVNLREIEQKAAESARFLRVSIEGFWNAGVSLSSTYIQMSRHLNMARIKEHESISNQEISIFPYI